jgi:hypothetical protein
LLTTNPRFCRLHLTLGRAAACPQETCPFWEEGGAAVEPGCAVERLGLDAGRPDIARFLLDLRAQLDAAREREDEAEARRVFAALVPPELAGR